MKTWKIRSSNHASARSLADALDIPFALARILVSRSYGTPEAASAFLYASMEELSRPFELPNMGAAVERIHSKTVMIDRYTKRTLLRLTEHPGVSGVPALPAYNGEGKTHRCGICGLRLTHLRKVL